MTNHPFEPRFLASRMDQFVFSITAFSQTKDPRIYRPRRWILFSADRSSVIPLLGSRANGHLPIFFSFSMLIFMLEFSWVFDCWNDLLLSSRICPCPLKNDLRCPIHFRVILQCWLQALFELSLVISPLSLSPQLPPSLRFRITIGSHSRSWAFRPYCGRFSIVPSPEYSTRYCSIFS